MFVRRCLEGPPVFLDPGSEKQNPPREAPHTEQRSSTALVVSSVQSTVGAMVATTHLCLATHFLELHAVSELDLMSPPTSSGPSLVWSATP